MHPVLRTVLQRLGLGIVTLLAVSVIIFSSLEMLPGGYAENVLGQSATPETVAAFKRDLGLDRPATVRYFEWIGKAVQGDFGSSDDRLAGMGGADIGSGRSARDVPRRMGAGDTAGRFAGLARGRGAADPHGG